LGIFFHARLEGAANRGQKGRGEGSSENGGDGRDDHIGWGRRGKAVEGMDPLCPDKVGGALPFVGKDLLFGKEEHIGFQVQKERGGTDFFHEAEGPLGSGSQHPEDLLPPRPAKKSGKKGKSFPGDAGDFLGDGALVWRGMCFKKGLESSPNGRGIHRGVSLGERCNGREFGR
jgi:hypothetical protein